MSFATANLGPSTPNSFNAQELLNKLRASTHQFGNTPTPPISSIPRTPTSQISQISQPLATPEPKSIEG